MCVGVHLQPGRRPPPEVATYSLIRTPPTAVLFYDGLSGAQFKKKDVANSGFEACFEHGKLCILKSLDAHGLEGRAVVVQLCACGAPGDRVRLCLSF
ncbi:hypothetical protein EVAR_337_1 [Eumeta japonica]|uniref:Uncharacterized protein n=1 Tax=Eumeta variegata TaxID=151549 RepID=A0A4C1S9W2_EUMVA|nr:hypothetical protein EVAR_337_1 [Eumeta japonica]